MVLDSSFVYEDISLLLRFDKAIPLFFVVPFDLTFRHRWDPPYIYIFVLFLGRSAGRRPETEVMCECEICLVQIPNKFSQSVQKTAFYMRIEL